MSVPSDSNNNLNGHSSLWLNAKTASPAWVEWPGRHAVSRYLAAIFAVSIAAAARLILQPVLHDDAPFSMFYLAVVIISYVAGCGPAILVTAAGAAAGWWFMMPQPNPLWDAFFCAVSATIIWAMELRRQERNRAEAALRLLRESHEQQRAAFSSLDKSEQQLRFALEIGAVGTCIFDRTTKTITCDERCRAILGLAELTSGDKVWWGLVVPDDRTRVTKAFTSAVRSATPQPGLIETRISRPDGQVRWISVGVGGPSTSPSGRAEVFGFVQDITERKHSEKQLARMQSLESVGLLAAGLGHKFNNLLMIVLGSSKLLHDKVTDECQALTSAITEAGLQAAELTEQLLAYAGKSFSFIDEVDLSGAVRAVSAMVQPSISKHVTVHHSLGPNLTVRADRGQIKQIVMNLVTNAAEAIPQNQKGDIFIRTGVQEIAPSHDVIDEISQAPVPPNSYFYLEVRDTGSGMSKEIQHKIFEPFFTTKFTGRGLGLSAVAGILRNQHGFIQVISAPGQGSSFRVLLSEVNSGTAAADTEKLSTACGRSAK
jgi:PAS domain S-box-containing protein